MEDIASFEETLFHDAISLRASDIHIEPREGEWEIRIRVNGLLRGYQTLAKQAGAALIQRLKAKGNMDIGERRLPQDGRFSISDGRESYDLRLSSIPTIAGEKLGIRILYPHPAFHNITELGMSHRDCERLLQWINETTGLILVTGPTGSGKTTTLYAILQHLNDGRLNISTIEDPVEFRIHGLNQMQVNEAAGLTFSRGLRALLRQDPDVIMIGEIRDRETAVIAVRAALTGHLVLATLHAVSAEGAAARLLDLGIEPYLFRTAIKGIMAQRMVLRPCPHPHHHSGCDICGGTGVLDRVPVFHLAEYRGELPLAGNYGWSAYGDVPV